MTDFNQQIHDEFYECIELLKKVVNHNFNINNLIKEVLDNNENLCLDSIEDKKKLLSLLTEKLNIKVLDKFVRINCKNQ